MSFTQDIAMNTLWYSSTPNEVPDASDPTAISGAVAINTADGLMWVNVTGGDVTGDWELVSGSGGGGSMSSFTLAGDAGSNQNISNGNTVTIAGGTNITTTGSATDTITITAPQIATNASDMTTHLADSTPHSAYAVTLTGTQTLTNKTLTTPTISSTGFTNAQHAHTGDSSGGAISATTLSGLSDTAISSPASAQMLIYDGSNSWDNHDIGGDITISSTGSVIVQNNSHTHISTNITTAIPVSLGGTGQTAQTAGFDALSPLTTIGDIIYFNGTDNVRLAKGASGTTLTMGGSDIPTWAASGSDVDMTNGVATRMLTATDSDTINAESELTFIADPAGNIAQKVIQGYGYAFLETNGSGDFLQVQAAPSIGTSWVWKFPAAIGTAGQVLQISSVSSSTIANLAWVTVDTSDSQHSHTGTAGALAYFDSANVVGDATSNSDGGDGTGVNIFLKATTGMMIAPSKGNQANGARNGYGALGGINMTSEAPFASMAVGHYRHALYGFSAQNSGSERNHVYWQTLNSYTQNTGAGIGVNYMRIDAGDPPQITWVSEHGFDGQAPVTGYSIVVGDKTRFHNNIEPHSSTIADNGYLGTSSNRWKGIYAGDAVFNSIAVPFTAGSTAAPGIYFDADTTTGFYRPGANRIGVSIEDSLKWETYSDGNVYFYGGTYHRAGWLAGGTTGTGNKSFTVSGTHYTSGEENQFMIGHYAVSGQNYLYIGGGSSAYNASTYIYFYAASASTTTSGSSVSRMSNSSIDHYRPINMVGNGVVASNTAYIMGFDAYGSNENKNFSFRAMQYASNSTGVYHEWLRFESTSQAGTLVLGGNAGTGSNITKIDFKVGQYLSSQFQSNESAMHVARDFTDLSNNKHTTVNFSRDTLMASGYGYGFRFGGGGNNGAGVHSAGFFTASTHAMMYGKSGASGERYIVFAFKNAGPNMRYLYVDMETLGTSGTVNWTASGTEPN